MELTHNVFQKNVCRPINIQYSEYTADFTPRTQRIKGFVGDLDNTLGRYGIYGRCRTPTLLDSLMRSKSCEKLGIVKNKTKSGFKRTRRKIGLSNRCSDPLELKSLRTNQTHLYSKTQIKSTKIIRKQSREYELNSVKKCNNEKEKVRN